jgi:ribonuclease T1
MNPKSLWRTLGTVLILAILAWQAWPALQQAPDVPQAAGSPAPVPAEPPPATQANENLPHFLPREAGPVIAGILAGATFPHRQDGSVFGNREGRLPRQARGYYREYTVPTPGLKHRGARRIVTGGDPPVQWYYTDDHYDSFRAFSPPPRKDLQ